jgi:hypothetical protein
MRPLFADTFYWMALLNRREVWYSRVVALSRTLGTRRLLTTEWVLAEFLAFYSAGGGDTPARGGENTPDSPGSPDRRPAAIPSDVSGWIGAIRIPSR